ncbi:MAG: transglycosylase SLT domain-containing protein [Rhodobacteraceae bacterium]|nr:transglycosylase SLT domain-containing protein [Paracoccaceae bacterium]
MLRILPVALCLGLVASCAPAPSDPPAMRWDHRPEALEWTEATLGALREDGRLSSTVPADVGTFCPGYESADATSRKAFWSGLFSALARYESTWNPQAAGAGGRYRGLLQIMPATARHHGCEIAAPDALYDGAVNLSCAVRIASAAVARDGVVAGGPGAWGGVAADWPPLRNPAKRADIAAFTASQDYCRAGS